MKNFTIAYPTFAVVSIAYLLWGMGAAISANAAGMFVFLYACFAFVLCTLYAGYQHFRFKLAYKWLANSEKYLPGYKFEVIRLAGKRL